VADAYEDQLAAAVVAELNDTDAENAPAWTVPFRAETRPLPVFELLASGGKRATLADLQCSVLGTTIENVRLNREKHSFTHTIAIVLQKLVDVADAVEIGRLKRTAEQVQDYYLDGHDLATMPGWAVIDAQRVDVCDFDRLYDGHRFDTIIELTIAGQR
jgi:hypothetical protein